MAYFTTKVARSMLAVPGRAVLSGALSGSTNPPSLSRWSSSVNSDAAKKPIKTISDLPGPMSLPIIGTAWTFFAGANGQPLRKRMMTSQLEDVKKYGKIFQTQSPGMKVVSVADPADVAKLLRSEPKYPKRITIPVLEYYRQKRQKIPGVFFADGPEWYKHRSVLSKRMLRPKEVADYASGFNEIITDFIHRLRTVREPGGSEKENEVCDLDNELFKWSFESVAQILFDKRFGCLEPEVNKEAQTFIKAVGDFLYNLMGVGLLPTWFYKIYETEQLKKFLSSLDTMYEYAELFIQRKIHDLEEQQYESQSSNPSALSISDKVGFFEFLLSSGKLTKDDLLATVIDVLFAGVDTTSNTMQWMLYMMAKNPDKQDILRQEVLSVLGDTTLATPTTLKLMPYLKAWVRETLRLYPFIAIPRQPTEDLVLSGYFIPGGTAHVAFLTFSMGRDEELFENAEAFKPERWLREKDFVLTKAVEAFSSIPFGFGTRMCLGRRIAELELHLLLARIVQQFDISYPPDAENVEYFTRGVTVPDRAVRVKFVDRQ